MKYFLHKTKEVDCKAVHYINADGMVSVHIEAIGDLDHHVIEELYLLLDKIACDKGCCHKSKDWRGCTNERISTRNI